MAWNQDESHTHWSRSVPLACANLANETKNMMFIWACDEHKILGLISDTVSNNSEQVHHYGLYGVK